MASIWGNNLKISIFGQSHSAAIGVTIDGLPVGTELNMEELQAFLKRRAPGQNAYSTPRREADAPEILSGLFGGKTCGAPLTAVIRNENTRSKDYSEMADTPRPGHADFTARIKYGGFEDYTGGGHFSGRLTAPLCIAGGICKQILRARGVEIGAHIASIGPVKDRLFDPVGISAEELCKLQAAEFPVLEPETAEKMQAATAAARSREDSVGGVIECAVVGAPAGLGSPMFDGAENRIASIVFGIPAVKGIEFGRGFESATAYGSENNDPYYFEGETVKTKTNNHGGILGGITSGMPIVFRAAFKPTPSIGKTQDSVSYTKGENVPLAVRGRHDPCIVPRAVPCIEAAAAIAVLDMMLDGDNIGGK